MKRFVEKEKAEREAKWVVQKDNQNREMRVRGSLLNFAPWQRVAGVIELLVLYETIKHQLNGSSFQCVGNNPLPPTHPRSRA